MRFLTVTTVGVFCLLSMFGSGNAFGTTVYADSYGWNATDSTAALQAAINSGADTVIVRNMGSPWYVTPITLASNQHITFQTGVEVDAKPGAFLTDNQCLFTASAKTNITLDGYGATLKMQKAAYTTGEHRHGLNILSSSNITVQGLTIKDTGGDGIYLGTTGTTKYNSNVTLTDVVSDNNRRQGISIISVDGLTVNRCSFINTTGTVPAAGMDFEPNAASHRLTNVNVSNTTIYGNDGWGVLVYDIYQNNTSAPMSMTFTDCSVGTDGFGVYDRNTGDPARGAAAPTGLITLDNLAGTVTVQSSLAITVVQTPEPASMTLLLAGTAVLLRRRKNTSV